MKILLGSAFIAIGLVGCATPRENAILGGAILGAAATAIITQPPQPQFYYHPYPMPRLLYCRSYVVGYDMYHRPIYQQVCR